MSYSKYTSTENLKITYLLGAGASYNSNPIWKAQGQSMINVANLILKNLEVIILANPDTDKYFELRGDEGLINFFKDLRSFGEFAVEYGSIDIYAKRLSLIENNYELNKLKFCLSVYFDIWENFLQKEFILKKGNDIYGNDDMYYDKIDKRYFSFLSVILEKGENNFPKINDNVSILTWNYDLQFENAFETFMPRKSISFDDTNNYLNFMNNKTKRSEVIHLNGFRGYFTEQDKVYETVEKKSLENLPKYLKQFKRNFKDFKNPNYNSIKYAWEENSESIQNAKQIMAETNILIIIGYSFPAFNRKIDGELFKEFENSNEYKKVYYQDPFGNLDLVNLLFSNPEIINPITDTSQFHIPHEFLNPSAGAEIYI